MPVIMEGRVALGGSNQEIIQEAKGPGILKALDLVPGIVPTALWDTERLVELGHTEAEGV